MGVKQFFFMQILSFVSINKYDSWSHVRTHSIQLFRERLSKKKTKVHATRPKARLGIHKNFASWPREMYEFVFFNVKNCFSSQEAFFYSFISTVASI